MGPKKYRESWQRFLASAISGKPEPTEQDELEETIKGISQECKQMEEKLDNPSNFWNAFRPKEAGSTSGTTPSTYGVSEGMTSALPSGGGPAIFPPVASNVKVIQNEMNSNLFLANDSTYQRQGTESQSNTGKHFEEASKPVWNPIGEQGQQDSSRKQECSQLQEAQLEITVRNGALLSGGCCIFTGKINPHFDKMEIRISPSQIGNIRRIDPTQERWMSEYSIVSIRKRAKEDDEFDMC